MSAIKTVNKLVEVVYCIILEVIIEDGALLTDTEELFSDINVVIVD